MSVFDLVKQNVSLPEAAERYGIDVNRYKKALCPFHNDHHPSLFVSDDHYHCFACGAHGDVIDLVSKLFQLSLYDAALKLAADFNLDPTISSRVPPMSRKSRIAEMKRRKDKENRCFNTLNDYLWVLRDWEKRYAPASPEAELDARFIEACQRLAYTEYLTDSWLLGDDAEREAICAGKGFKEIESRLAQIRLEEKENAQCTPVAG